MVASSDTRPVVAVVGRPNVGKSTLVNRIVGRREAIVEERPGVTRDRKVLEAEWAGHEFSIVDTGGWLAAGDDLARRVSAQAERAIAEAAVVMLVVDATVGITDEDARVATRLRRLGRPTLVVANKVDGDSRDSDAWVFSRLGLGDPHPVSALHGRNTGDLLGRGGGPLAGGAGWRARRRRRAGRCPVGGHRGPAQRGQVHPLQPAHRGRALGRTRPARHHPRQHRHVGVHARRRREVRRHRRHAAPGQGSGGRRVLLPGPGVAGPHRADAALLVIDASGGITRQDQRLAERVDAAGHPVVVILNKWELLDATRRAQVSADLEDRLGFLGYAPVLKVSARTGLGVHKLYPALRTSLAAAQQRVATGELNRVLAQAQAAHRSPGGRILYATQGGTDPPTFTLFATRAVPAPYLRYLERTIREHFGFGPTPLVFRVRRRAG